MTDFQWPIRVYYEDTDSGGVVYYANYLKFMERARTEYLRQLGFEQDVLVQQFGLVFAVRSAKLEYLKPARFNDQLLVSARVTATGSASVDFYQQVVREQAPDTTLCTGDFRIVCLDQQAFKPARIPQKIVKEITRAV